MQEREKERKRRGGEDRGRSAPGSLSPILHPFLSLSTSPSASLNLPIGPGASPSPPPPNTNPPHLAVLVLELLGLGVRLLLALLGAAPEGQQGLERGQLRHARGRQGGAGGQGAAAEGQAQVGGGEACWRDGEGRRGVDGCEGGGPWEAPWPRARGARGRRVGGRGWAVRSDPPSVQAARPRTAYTGRCCPRAHAHANPWHADSRSGRPGGPTQGPGEGCAGVAPRLRRRAGPPLISSRLSLSP